LSLLVKKHRNLTKMKTICFYTFNILSGEDTGKIFRVQVGTPEMMDAGLDQDEANYWSKNVGHQI